jgi:hypothetical protein
MPSCGARSETRIAKTRTAGWCTFVVAGQQCIDKCRPVEMRTTRYHGVVAQPAEIAALACGVAQDVVMGIGNGFIGHEPPI